MFGIIDCLLRRVLQIRMHMPMVLTVMIMALIVAMMMPVTKSVTWWQALRLRNIGPAL
jgi:hypothetical protein